MSGRYETIKVELDEELYFQAQQILEQEGITMEQAVQLFFQWIVDNSELAKEEICTQRAGITM